MFCGFYLYKNTINRIALLFTLFPGELNQKKSRQPDKNNIFINMIVGNFFIVQVRCYIEY